MNNRPAVIVFDVNETLSDVSQMAEQFLEVGAPADLAAMWFAGLLRDGFALATTGDSEKFAAIGAGVLHGPLRDVDLNTGLAEAAGHIMSGLDGLVAHPDVVDGVWALRAAGFRLGTLSNGST